MKIKVKYDVKVLNRFNIGGIVLYPWVLFQKPKEEVPDWLFRHEMEHVYQVREQGWLNFYTKYLWYQLKYGYKHNPYEISARLTEKYPLTEKEKMEKNETPII